MFLCLPPDMCEIQQNGLLAISFFHCMPSKFVRMVRQCWGTAVVGANAELGNIIKCACMQVNIVERGIVRVCVCVCVSEHTGRS